MLLRAKGEKYLTYLLQKWSPVERAKRWIPVIRGRDKPDPTIKTSAGPGTWAGREAGKSAMQFIWPVHLPPGSAGGVKWKLRQITSLIFKQSWKLWQTLGPVVTLCGDTRAPDPLVTLFPAWCLRNEGVSSVLLGSSNPEQLIENLGAIQASAGGGGGSSCPAPGAAPAHRGAGTSLLTDA